MQVIAQTGTRCPMEGKRGKFITDSQAENVPESAYYLRLVTDGSLVRQDKEPLVPGSETDANSKTTRKTGR